MSTGFPALLFLDGFIFFIPAVGSADVADEDANEVCVSSAFFLGRPGFLFVTVGAGSEREEVFIFSSILLNILN